MIDLSGIKTQFSGKPLAVLGLGRTGLAVIRSCAAAAIPVLCWDDAPAQRQEAEKHGATISELSASDLENCAALVLAPGIPHTWPAPHPAVARAKKIGLPVIGDFELFAMSKPAAKIIAITGTNGKSTTTALIGHILQSAGRKTAVGGNLGQALLSLNDPGADGFFVLEMSSYQLELCPLLQPDIAVFLNLSADHIDRHGDMYGYITAKKNIFRGPGIAIIGTDDEDTCQVAAEIEKRGERDVIRISSDAAPQEILKDAPALPGRHNAQNTAAAWAVAKTCGLSGEQTAQGIKTFPGLAHRQQVVATINDIRYINDSKATNADATARALACYDPVYWIAGGQAKEGGLSGLEGFMPRIRHAFLIGEAQENFSDWLNAHDVACKKCGTLAIAARQAHTMAQEERLENAVVLLSPACASWDQFRNFEHRGEVFAAEIAKFQRETP